MSDISGVDGTTPPPADYEKFTIISGDDVKVKTMDDYKKIVIRNNDTGEEFTAFDYMMEQMGIKVAQDAEKAEKHRQKTLKDIKNGG